jgi:hypothetical protein
MYRYWLLTFIQGKNLRYFWQWVKLEDLPEGVSRNSLKTGKKHGGRSKEALERKWQKFLEKKKIQKAAQEAAEGKCGMFIHRFQASTNRLQKRTSSMRINKMIEARRKNRTP